MVIVPLDGAERFLKADVVKAGKRCTCNVFDCVIRHKEVLLAYITHKNATAALTITLANFQTFTDFNYFNVAFMME